MKESSDNALKSKSGRITFTNRTLKGFSSSWKAIRRSVRSVIETNVSCHLILDHEGKHRSCWIRLANVRQLESKAKAEISARDITCNKTPTTNRIANDKTDGDAFVGVISGLAKTSPSLLLSSHLPNSRDHLCLSVLYCVTACVANVGSECTGPALLTPWINSLHTRG